MHKTFFKQETQVKKNAEIRHRRSKSNTTRTSQDTTFKAHITYNMNTTRFINTAGDLVLSSYSYIRGKNSGRTIIHIIDKSCVNRCGTYTQKFDFINRDRTLYSTITITCTCNILSEIYRTPCDDFLKVCPQGKTSVFKGFVPTIHNIYCM